MKNCLSLENRKKFIFSMLTLNLILFPNRHVLFESKSSEHDSRLYYCLQLIKNAQNQN